MKPDAEPFIYVISEKEHLAFLPAGALRILVTAELSVIQERFARRTGGKLPPPLAAMLEKSTVCSMQSRMIFSSKTAR